MKTIILGAGKVGVNIVENLLKEGHNIVVIDKNPKKVEMLVGKYNVTGIVGSGVEREILNDAGVKDADFFISCTPYDELNAICSVFAKKVGARYTVARIRDPQYFKEQENIAETLNIDLVFNPEYRTAKEIVRILRFPSAISVESFASNRINLVGFVVSAGNLLIDKTVQECASINGYKTLFGIIKRDGEAIIPHGDFVIKEGDEIYLIGQTQDLVEFCKKTNIFINPAKSVLISGGGKIAYYLAKELIKDGTRVKIIEVDEARSQELANELKGVDVFLGDGTDREVLDEEGLKSTDAFVALTGIDEENALISLYAKQVGVDKVITKITRPQVFEMSKSFGLDTILSPQKVIANFVVKFARTAMISTGSAVKRLYKLGDQAEALEFCVGEDFKGLNVKIKDLKLREDVLIGFIAKGKEVELPNGNSTIRVGDRVLILTLAGKIKEINEIIK